MAIIVKKAKNGEWAVFRNGRKIDSGGSKAKMEMAANFYRGFYAKKQPKSRDMDVQMGWTQKRREKEYQKKKRRGGNGWSFF